MDFQDFSILFYKHDFRSTYNDSLLNIKSKDYTTKFEIPIEFESFVISRQWPILRGYYIYYNINYIIIRVDRIKI